MPYREVTMFEVKEVLRLWLTGVAKKRIATQLGLDRKTVRHYLRVAVAAGITTEAELTDERLVAVMATLRTGSGRPHGETWSQCQRQRSFIESSLRGGVRLSKVRRLLQRRGVRVPYPTLHRFAVEELGFGRRAATIAVADCGPGEEVQLDTGWMALLAPDATGPGRGAARWRRAR